ncbi:exopolyphosphatase [Bermanella sp. 47_1433_sub80_T6]|nr:exopolyphosphatase [Bermanella sp. 47_1433_sub80_T6]
MTDTLEHSVQGQQMLAAIDLGSNSFHLVLARLINGQVQIIEKRGEKVMLAAGLHPVHGISEDAQERALACLKRFGQSISSLQRSQVVILGTNTLRAASNSREFMVQAEEALGFPIEVISGIEEARLVYLGVAHTLADDDGKRLVIDIGGGSTEFVIGERFAPIRLESLHMGCVSYSDRYFPEGKISEAGFKMAIASARRELMSIRFNYQRLGWHNVVGSSGTMRAVDRVLRAYELSDSGINLTALLELKRIILKFKQVGELDIKGVKEQRLKVFPAGVAILIAIFESLEINKLTYSDGALREGALYDLLGRVKHEDVRELTVKAMQERFQVDMKHAQNVKTSAINFYYQVRDKWKIDETEYEDYLRWGAGLHEVGLAIAHNQYHKHGAYLVQYSDMPGFSKPLQEILAILLRTHRRKLSDQELNNLSKRSRNALRRLIVILRLAVLLHHGRGEDAIIEPVMSVEKSSLHLVFPEGYLSDHAMTELDLQREKNQLSDTGFELTFE